MKPRDNLFLVVVPVIQIVFFIFMYDLANYMAHKLNMIDARGVGWGIAAKLYAVYYILIVILLAILVSLKQKLLLFSIIAALIFSMIVFPLLDEFPYRAGLVILLGVTGIFIHYFFHAIRLYKAKARVKLPD